jgi:hypothetical protein
LRNLRLLKGHDLSEIFQKLLAMVEAKMSGVIKKSPVGKKISPLTLIEKKTPQDEICLRKTLLGQLFGEKNNPWKTQL